MEDKIRWYDEMTFIEPGGRTSVMHASPLPAPLHTAPSFLRFPFLTVKDKLAISRAIAALTLTSQPDTRKIVSAMVSATTARPKLPSNASGNRFWSALSAKIST